ADANITTALGKTNKTFFSTSLFAPSQLFNTENFVQNAEISLLLLDFQIILSNFQITSSPHINTTTMRNLQIAAQTSNYMLPEPIFELYQLTNSTDSNTTIKQNPSQKLYSRAHTATNAYRKQ
ncbi:15996_t:CDS:2, partial [Gigaspora margarita]